MSNGGARPVPRRPRREDVVNGALRQDGEVAHHVYVLWHGDDLGEGAPEAKLLGVYSSEAAAKDRIHRCLREGVAGFAEHPDDFHVDRYQVDKDEWAQGYVEVE
jgi:hypothetical protein